MSPRLRARTSPDWIAEHLFDCEPADGRKFKSTWSFAKLSNGAWYPALHGSRSGRPA